MTNEKRRFIPTRRNKGSPRFDLSTGLISFTFTHSPPRGPQSPHATHAKLDPVILYPLRPLTVCSITSSASVGQIGPVRILRGDGDWLEDSLLLAESILSASFTVVAAGFVSLEIVIALFPFIGALQSLPWAFLAHCDFDDALLCFGFRKVSCGLADGFKLWKGEELVLDMYWGPTLPAH